ncbi:hypothetical protein DRN98_03020, partial [Methanosarcinales archaeon]
MIKNILLVTIVFLILLPSFSQFPVVALSPGQISEGNISLYYRNVTVYAPAVANTDNGYVGVISTITVTVQSNGSGRVFVDTLPLTQIDMQGSARLAVKVASAFVENDNSCNVTPSNYDFFFVVRTDSPIIGGPSAGGVMTVATIALLENWTINNKTVMTGMINPDGSIGPIGGIPEKIDAAHSVGATRFLIPKGQGTYTEMVTETTVENGWTQIITHPVTRNVSDYAMQNYGMDVKEVADINDALLYLTGHTFSVPESNEQITTENYIDSMKPLASTLLNEANNSYKNASDSLDNSTISNRYPFYYKNQITDIFNDAETQLQEAEEWYGQELYYSSTSKSFQSLIDSRFVIYACEYFNSDDEQGYIQTLLDEARSLYNNESIKAKNATINGTISLQCVGAAQKRVSDASSYISDAENSFDSHDYLTSLYKIAYAIERSKSVGWWLNISSYFNDSGKINNTMLTNLNEEYIEDAQQSIAYSNILLQEMGKSSQYLNDANNLLDSARADKESYPAAALFEALEALVKGNLALELVDGVTNDKIERARESASNSISESRSSGIEPVLAVSYYEYAQSLSNASSLDDAIVYYKYSDIIAGLVGLTSASGTRSSRYVGIPEVGTPGSWFGFFGSNVSTIFFIVSIIFFFVIGIIAGFGIGLIIFG